MQKNKICDRKIEHDERYAFALGGGYKYENGTYHLDAAGSFAQLSASDGIISSYTAELISATDYYAFGAPLPGRTWQGGEYRFGFNGMAKEDDISGAGNSYSTEYREYDSRLGRWFSLDPLFKNFSWQSPYAAFDNNPILIKDPKGLAGEIANGGVVPEDKADRKYNRKFEKWQKKNRNFLEKEKMDPMQRAEAFKADKNIFGKVNADTRWHKRHENHIKPSNTGWKVKVDVPSSEIGSGEGGSVGSLNQYVDLGTESGQLQINYNMFSLPDRLQVVDPVTGQVLFDTKNVQRSTANGEVKRKNGSGTVINFSLPSGNTIINILINDGAPVQDSQFKYSLKLNPNTVQLGTVKQKNR